MILTESYRHTVLDIWTPKYSTKYTDKQEQVVLLAKYKVDHATPLILINFTKAKHLEGQRYCIYRSQAQKFPLVSNGRIDCYEIPMSHLDTWEKASEHLPEHPPKAPTEQ